jgi:MarR family transcriptional regulator, transcriptional regulator for hemolysin
MEQVRHFGFILKDVQRLWVRLFEQRIPQLGMTFTQCKVLVFLSRNEGTTQAKLAEASDTEPMTLVRVLDRMERDDWIERRPDPTDRRAYRLHLRPASSPVLQEILRIAEKARNEALGGLSAEQREQMTDMLEHVRKNLVGLVSAGEPNPSAEARSTRQNGKHDDSVRGRRIPPRTTQTRRRKATT